MLQASIASPRAPGNGPGWTDARTERLKALWAEGRSASEIAGLLGEVTRNAVIGKVHRLGLAGRKTTSRQPVPRRTSPRRGKSGASSGTCRPLALCVQPPHRRLFLHRLWRH
jgi:hypothetical protein